jgi:Transcriptional Coactivator p15 (PC4)
MKKSQDNSEFNYTKSKKFVIQDGEFNGKPSWSVRELYLNDENEWRHGKGGITIMGKENIEKFKNWLWDNLED